MEEKRHPVRPIDSVGGGAFMGVDFNEVELGLLVNLKTLREVLKGLSIGGKRWWIASDPQDAVEDGAIFIGHGDARCVDRLNTLTFRVPVLNDETPRGGTDRIVVLLDPSTSSSKDPGYYIENGRVMQDPLEDFFCFYHPIKRALIARLQAGE
jgi:hypothetical protein